MALLTGIGCRQAERTRAARRFLSVLLWGSLLVATLSCSVEQAPVDDGPAFSHAEHVVQLGLSCNVCHLPGAPSDAGSDRPAMPPRDLCLLCHRSLDGDKPVDRVAGAFFAGDTFQGSRPTVALGDEIVFSHRSHVDQVADCERCHPGIERSTRVEQVQRLGMDDCTSCHASERVEQGCAACHRELGTHVPPASHALDWTRMHGEIWRHRSPTLADRCELCHTETSCVACHRAEMPANHNNAWRLRLHGLDASFDRTSCQVCHTDDSCSRCHAVTEPLSHTGSWGSPTDTHCYSCHFPLGNETCVVCHKSTPSHGDATPMPPGHDRAFDCRQCHGNGAPLPHVDNGSSCTACHR